MHPFVSMLMFLLMLLIAGVVSAPILIALLLVVSIYALKRHYREFLSTLKRMRWFFLSILLIYAFGTPGEFVSFIPPSVAPTIEGLNLGFLQISRLIITLATLNVLLTTLSRSSLMLALYMLLMPLKYCGLNVQKFSVRLLLTLNYVDEIASKAKTRFSFKHFNEIHRELESIAPVDIVTVEKQSFSMVDKMVMVLMLLVLGFMMAMRLL